MRDQKKTDRFEEPGSHRNMDVKEIGGTACGNSVVILILRLAAPVGALIKGAEHLEYERNDESQNYRASQRI